MEGQTGRIMFMADSIITKPGRACLFCGKSLRSKTASAGAIDTNEHIVPQWLQKYLGIEGDIIKPLLVRKIDSQPVHVREHVFGSFKSGRVCAECNGGWMCELENSEKPILISMIEGTLMFQELRRDESIIIARWTLKTAAALNRSSIYGDPKQKDSRPVADHHLRQLAYGGMPPDVLVVGTTYSPEKPFDFLQNAEWRNPKNSIPLPEAHRIGNYKIALSFGKLILIAAYYPSNDYAYVVNSGGMTPIWSERRIVDYKHIWDDSYSKMMSPRLEVPMRNINVVSHTWQTLVDNMAFTRFISL